MSVSPSLLFLACAASGVMAAILGLGGGIFIVPVLALGMGLPVAKAAGISLVCCLATSAGGSVALDKAKLADFRTIAFLEPFAAIGSLVAAWYVARGKVPEQALNGAFGVMLAWAALRMLRRELLGKKKPAEPEPDSRPEGDPEPVAANWPLACGLSVIGGASSGLLGIGGGALKTPIQTELVGLSLPVALANSNVMVGITAAFAAAVYFGQGALSVDLTGPCALGAALGAYLGGLVAPHLKNRVLALGFVLVLGYVAGKMLWKALLGTA